MTMYVVEIDASEMGKQGNPAERHTIAADLDIGQALFLADLDAIQDGGYLIERVSVARAGQDA
jgi:hypothetical protein